MACDICGHYEIRGACTNTECKRPVDRLVMPDYYPGHNTESEECWREPEIEIVDGTKIITHRGVH